MARLTYVVTIKKKELFYDIDAQTHGLSQFVGQAGTPQQADALSSETAVQIDNRTVSRYAENRYNSLRSLLVEFLADSTTTSDDNTLDSSASYVFTFSVSPETTERALASLAPLLHEYFVKGILMDWYQGKGSDKGNVYAQRLADIENRLLVLLYEREIPKATVQ